MSVLTNFSRHPEFDIALVESTLFHEVRTLTIT